MTFSLLYCHIACCLVKSLDMAEYAEFLRMKSRMKIFSKGFFGRCSFRKLAGLRAG